MKQATPRKHPARDAAILVFCVAILVRMIYLGEYASKPWYGFPILDSRVWIEQAQGIAAGEALTRDFYFRPPLYSLYLAALTLMAPGQTYYMASLSQLILGAVFCVVMFACTVVCWNITAGIAAGLLCALYAPLVFYEAEVLSDSIALLLSGFFLLFWLLGIKREKVGWFAASGIAAGLSAITRPNIVLVVALFVAAAAMCVLWLRRRGQAEGAITVKGIACFLAPFVVLVAIPTAHSAALGDRTFIASQGGINFWIGNHEGGNGLNCVFPHVVEGVTTEQYKDAAERFGRIGYLMEKHGEVEGLQRFNEEGDVLRPSLLSSYWYRKGFEFVRQNPGEAFRLTVLKKLGLVNNYEVRNNKEFYFVRDNLSTVLKLIPFTFGSLFMLAVPGIWLAVYGQASRRLAMWVLLLIVGLSASIVLFFVGGRLRLPLVLGLFPFAGIAVDCAWTSLRERRWKSMTGIVASAALAGFVSFYHWPQMDFRYDKSQEPGHGIYATSNYAIEWAFLASALYDAEKFELAIEMAEKASRLDPNLPFPYQIMANALERLNRDEEAVLLNYKLLEQSGNNSVAINNLGVLAEKRGDFQRAVQLYEYAQRLNPYLPRVMGNLAVMHARVGNRKRSLFYARRALHYMPSLGTAQVVMHHYGEKKITNITPGLQNLLSEVQKPLPGKVVFHQSVNPKLLLDRVTTGTALGK